jgi:hypothetical protein
VAADRPAGGDKTKNPIFFNGLGSFDAAVDCAAANNGLKRRWLLRGRSESPVGAGIGSHYQKQDHFLDAERMAFRVRKMLCCRAANRSGELGKR